MTRVLDPAPFIGEHRGQSVGLFQLHHPSGLSVSVCNLGAKVMQVLVPRPCSERTDVALGYDSLAGLLVGTPSMGAFIGRYAGRVGEARYDLDGTAVQLLANDGPHSLHGGPQGSRHQVFQVVEHRADRLVLQHRFDSATDGHPGTLNLRLTHQLLEGGRWRVSHEAHWVAGPASPASFTSHVFFNLNGTAQERIDDHVLRVDADTLLSMDADGVATGQRERLDGHALDFRRPRPLIDSSDLDHAYELGSVSELGGLRPVAQLHSLRSQLSMAVWTTEPVMQVYTAQHLGRNQPDIGKRGQQHRPRSALCLEPQQYPNAMNCPSFAIKRVTAGHPYLAQTEYRFSN
jgi:aldose 1-epimerase